MKKTFFELSPTNMAFSKLSTIFQFLPISKSILTCRKAQRDSLADSDFLIVADMFLILFCSWTEVVVRGHSKC